MASYDAVIVGAGPGGGASAWALSRAGLRVLVLDAGPAYDPGQDYRLYSASWEQTGFPERAPPVPGYSVAGLQDLLEANADLRSWNRLHGPYNPTQERRALAYHHVRGIGGSTLHFTGEAHRLNPAAMNLRSRFGVGADWPLTYQELEPYYEQAEAVLGVAGPDPDPGRPRRKPFPLPAHPLGYAGSKLRDGAARLGLNWGANALAILSQPYQGRPPCNRCGACRRGCPRTDKGSVDVTFIRQAQETGNCTLAPNSPAFLVEAGDHDRIRAIQYRDPTGQVREARGRIFILACGAVHTPRLLLSSKGPHSPQGLCNDEGQVGRHFMETLAWTSCALYPEPLASFRGVPVDGISWDFNHPDALPGIIGGCRFNHGTLEAELAGPISYAQRVVPGWGRAHKERMRAQFGRALAVGAIGEFLPNAQSFIDLDPLARDAAGDPLARIHSHLTPMDVERLRFMANKCREILAASGAPDLFDEYGTHDFFSSTHVFGTCRMGGDPRSSVVDPQGRSHRWKNLYVADASVFPSSGGGESPSLTIEALALRTADHIRHGDSTLG